MNIEHEGKTYEVLDATNPESIKLITHAKLAGGKVVGCELRNGDAIGDLIWLFHDGGQYGVYVGFLKDNNIQPLRLVPNDPVTFEATFYRSNSTAWVHGNGGAQYKTIRVRCVEIVEEA